MKLFKWVFNTKGTYSWNQTNNINKLFSARNKIVCLHIQVLAGAFDIPHEIKNPKQNLQIG